MVKLINTGRNVRIVNVRDGDRVRQVAVRPGAEVPDNVVETRAHKARVESGAFASPRQAKAAAKEEAEATEANVQPSAGPTAPERRGRQ